MAEWVTRRYTDITVTIWERRGNNPDGSPRHVRVGQVDMSVTRLKETEIRAKLRAQGYDLGGRDISWNVHKAQVYGVKEADFLAIAVPVSRSANGTVRPLD